MSLNLDQSSILAVRNTTTTISSTSTMAVTEQPLEEDEVGDGEEGEM